MTTLEFRAALKANGLMLVMADAVRKGICRGHLIRDGLALCGARRPVGTVYNMTEYAVEDQTCKKCFVMLKKAGRTVPDSAVKEEA